MRRKQTKAYFEGENNIPKTVLTRRKNQSRLLFVFLVLLEEAKIRDNGENASDLVG